MKERQPPLQALLERHTRANRALVKIAIVVQSLNSRIEELDEASGEVYIKGVLQTGRVKKALLANARPTLLSRKETLEGEINDRMEELERDVEEIGSLGKDEHVPQKAVETSNRILASFRQALAPAGIASITDTEPTSATSAEESQSVPVTPEEKEIIRPKILINRNTREVEINGKVGIILGDVQWVLLDFFAQKGWEVVSTREELDGVAKVAGSRSPAPTLVSNLNQKFENTWGVRLIGVSGSLGNKRYRPEYEFEFVEKNEKDDPTDNVTVQETDKTPERVEFAFDPVELVLLTSVLRNDGAQKLVGKGEEIITQEDREELGRIGERQGIILPEDCDEVALKIADKLQVYRDNKKAIIDRHKNDADLLFVLACLETNTETLPDEWFLKMYGETRNAISKTVTGNGADGSKIEWAPGPDTLTDLEICAFGLLLVDKSRQWVLNKEGIRLSWVEYEEINTIVNPLRPHREGRFSTDFLDEVYPGLRGKLINFSKNREDFLAQNDERTRTLLKHLNGLDQFHLGQLIAQLVPYTPRRQG